LCTRATSCQLLVHAIKHLLLHFPLLSILSYPSTPGPPPSPVCHPSPSMWRESRSSEVLQKDTGAGSHLQAGLAQPGGTETGKAGTSRAGGGHSTVRHACIECVIFFVSLFWYSSISRVGWVFVNYMHAFVGNTHCMAPLWPLCLYKLLPLYSLSCVAVGFCSCEPAEEVDCVLQ